MGNFSLIFQLFAQKSTSHYSTVNRLHEPICLFKLNPLVSIYHQYSLFEEENSSPQAINWDSIYSPLNLGQFIHSRFFCMKHTIIA